MDPESTLEEQLKRAMADCERRINEARAIVLTRNDGVVTAHMTDLEREWLTLARTERCSAPC
jgi:hypothetical protein